jgi:hypothetical protein
MQPNSVIGAIFKLKLIQQCGFFKREKKTELKTLKRQVHNFQNIFDLNMSLIPLFLDVDCELNDDIGR